MRSCGMVNDAALRNEVACETLGGRDFPRIADTTRRGASRDDDNLSLFSKVRVAEVGLRCESGRGGQRKRIRFAGRRGEMGALGEGMRGWVMARIKMLRVIVTDRGGEKVFDCRPEGGAQEGGEAGEAEYCEGRLRRAGTSLVCLPSTTHRLYILPSA
ncbi:hypothetical protein BC834DRAFT_467870 [Gloeopeniophorella convolvens]|nr:hypothetical protein BC834DRAFT_467870 [Gloeopeniophorella convolvens]